MEPLEKDNSIDTIKTDFSEEEQYIPDVNISHFLDNRLKQIEDENRVNQLRFEYANSKQTKKPKKKWFDYIFPPRFFMART
jgi:hypothetical protein